MRKLCSALIPLSGLLVASCSSGGTDERPTCAVKVVANHHIAGILGRGDFPAFPVSPDDTLSIRGDIRMSDDSGYAMKNGNSLVAEGTYALEKTGEIAILVRQTQSSTHVWRGAYGLEGETNHVFFTDRVGSAIGMYMGTRVVEGDADQKGLAGDWHLFSTHVLFADQATTPGIHEVGRAFAGTVTVDEDGVMDGEGTESTNTNATLQIVGDPAENTGLSAFKDGGVELVLDYGGDPKTADRRSFGGGGTPDLLLMADGTPEDGASGLLVMMRQRTTEIDPTKLAGTYQLGMWTIFLKPDASGFDSAIGTLELTESGNFRISATNSLGVEFSYTGKYVIDPANNGGLTFEVSGTNETWKAAIDPKEATIVLLDNFTEQRSDGQVELNLMIGIRPVTLTEQ